MAMWFSLPQSGTLNYMKNAIEIIEITMRGKKWKEKKNGKIQRNPKVTLVQKAELYHKQCALPNMVQHMKSKKRR